MKNTKVSINFIDNSHTTKSKPKGKGKGKPIGTLVICAYCNGRGKDIIGLICPICDGKGKVRA